MFKFTFPLGGREGELKKVQHCMLMSKKKRPPNSCNHKDILNFQLCVVALIQQNKMPHLTNLIETRGRQYLTFLSY